MSCIVLTNKDRELLNDLPGEDEETLKGLIGIWMERNPNRETDHPTIEEIKSLISQLRGSQQSSTTPINIYAGTGENAHLSNFAVRPFTVTSTGIDPIAPIEGNFRTVEGAFQAQKLAYSSMSEQEQEAIRKQLENASGSEARRLGRSIKGLDTRKWDELSSSLMENLILASFKQNPQALQQLLATGNAELTHTQDKGKWGKEFPRILMKVRRELGSEEATQMLDDALLPPVIDSETPQDTYEDSDFDTTDVVTLKDLRAVELTYDPQVRRDRVSLIARMFSQTVDNLMENRAKEIDRMMMGEDIPDSLREGLTKELYALENRDTTIDYYTPLGIFKMIKDSFQDMINDSEENRIQAELTKLNILLGEDANNYSEEKKLAKARENAEYKLVEYQKMVDHFAALRDEASIILLTTEGLAIDNNSMSTVEADFSEDFPDGQNNDENDGSSMSKEESSSKDGWMTYYRHVSSHESLSKMVRKFISEMPKLDYEGYEEEDDLGNTRYLDPSYVHATLMDKLRNMITVEDMMPLLEDLAKNTTWVEQVIDAISQDDTLFSKFYQDFRKDFASYWIQKRIENPDGTYSIETVNINKPESIGYLLDSWRNNYDSGTRLSNNSIYNVDGSINKANAREGFDALEKFNNKFLNKDTDTKLELLKDPDNWEQLISFMKMVGIDPNPSTLRLALNNIKEVEGVEFTDPIDLLIPALHIILKGVKKGEADPRVLSDGTERRKDLINTFKSAYDTIANLLAEVTEDAIESSVRENDKTYYAHVNPSYLGKLMKQLKNALGDEERFNKFIQEEFGQYDWFKKDGKWRNSWLEELVKNPKMREALQHKVLLNYDKKEYSKWDDLDYTIVLLNEYWSEPKSGMAWYHVPILSDSPSAEFIRFKRYSNGTEVDEDGDPLTYEESILNRLINIVEQEYDRIQLVEKRFDAYQRGEDIEPIACFDKTLNKKTGEINKGGAEFKFIPELNNYTTEDGTSFLDKMAELKSNPTELVKFIKDTLYEVMEDKFEKAYEEWVEIGLLEETPEGKFKNLPSYKVTVGQSATNKKVTKALVSAKELIGDSFTKEMENLLKRVQNNKAFDDRVAEDLFIKIEDTLVDMASRGEVMTSEVSSIIKNLTTKNNAKEVLREYFWNSELATSQIIQLTTTDLAFYKNVEDFQKRYKEVHAPSLRLNTEAKFNGKTVGRKWERTIYIEDDEIVSNSYPTIESIIKEKVAKGELDSIDKDYILSQFRRVNIADAQAYRSLSSYKAVMAMCGDWTDEMETAMEHLENGTWTIEDFNTIWTWQTKKPYLYTQIANSSGVDGHSSIKTSVQHKNSEFLLLAIYNSIAGPLGKSGKLRAINDFMEKHTIDVTQFESTTKVGKQGVIRLNKQAVEAEQALLQEQSKPHTEYDAVTSLLEKATGIDKGQENPNVIHTVSYEDYGIQTATPEHIIDTKQLIGTQIRKLIGADLSDDPNFRIKVGNKSFTKQEWLDLYNKLNTENILQKFKEVSNEFKDIKKVEKLLLEEVRSNPRYGMDMVRAVTLNEKGQFNIPLLDPIQSQRVQTLLNSIIKSRVTKQQIRGGSLIQVSCYGLTDDLNMVFQDKDGNSLDWNSYKKGHPKATKEDYYSFVKRAQEKGELSVKCLECYMPAYSRELFEPLMDKNGKLDINKLPEGLRKAIGYRV